MNGLTNLDYNDCARKVLWQFGTSLHRMSTENGPIVFEKGNGCLIWDTNGREYIDGMSGVWVVNAGHGNKDIIDGITAQCRKISYAISEEGYANPRAIELALTLQNVSKNVYARAYFTCGGSEAVEIAIRFARLFHYINKRTHKKKILARRGSYHGSTLLAMAASSMEFFSNSIGPIPQGIIKCPQPKCFDCEFGLKYPECDCYCAKEVENIVKAEGPDTIAAFIGEPISTSSDIAIPPEPYWKEIRRICDEYNILLIADEIVTGFGRTGKMFGMEHFNINPDIATIAKGLTSGYSPLGGVLVSPKIADLFPENSYILPGFTFSNHAVSCAAGLANIQFIERENLLQKSTDMGNILLTKLASKLNGHPMIGQIRGIGLMAAVEIKTPSNPSIKLEDGSKIGQYFLAMLYRTGVHLRIHNGYLHIGPPLIIDEETIDRIIDKIKFVIDKIWEKASAKKSIVAKGGK